MLRALSIYDTSQGVQIWGELTRAFEPFWAFGTRAMAIPCTITVLVVTEKERDTPRNGMAVVTLQLH